MLVGEIVRNIFFGALDSGGIESAESFHAAVSTEVLSDQSGSGRNENGFRLCKCSGGSGKKDVVRCRDQFEEPFPATFLDAKAKSLFTSIGFRVIGAWPSLPRRKCRLRAKILNVRHRGYLLFRLR
jgi:hypothetical protein